ncbi:MAG TPA: hypothetical protein VNY05_45275 [Candidatus Acidoferrales bacterium]|nr:hypothetical protein [Candidatus Acidoferrales bacterium]
MKTTQIGAAFLLFSHSLCGQGTATGLTSMRTESGAVARTAQDKLNDAVSVKDFGVDPTGVADSTAGMQNAFNASKRIWIPCDVHLKTIASLAITQDHQIEGCSTATITNTTSNPVFDMQPAGTRRVYNVSFLLTGFAINAVNALRIGDPDRNVGSLDTANTVMSGTIANMVFNGQNKAAADPDRGKAAIPALATLRGYGACLSLSGAYKTLIQKNVFEGCGIGILLAGDDQMDVLANRFHNSGRNIHVKNLPGATYTRGGSNVLFNDLGASWLNVSLFVDNVDRMNVRSNFFESITDAATFIKTQGEADTITDGNVFVVGSATTTPVLDIAPYNQFIHRNNQWSAAGSPLNVAVSDANYAIAFPILAIFKNNTGLVTPKYPGVTDDSADDLHFAYNSIPNPANGKAPFGPMFKTPPWSLNAAAGGYVIDRQNLQGYVSIPLANQTSRRWLLKITGMILGGFTTWHGPWNALTAYATNDAVSFGSAAYKALAANTGVPPGTQPAKWAVVAAVGDIRYSASYIAGGVENKIRSADACHLTSSTQLQSCEAIVSAPPGQSGGGIVMVGISTSNAVIAGIELIPQPEEKARVKVSSSAAIPVVGTYDVGDLVLNTMAANGGPPAWICTAAGTMNSIASSTTGTISVGSPALAINSDKFLSVGEYITIPGVSGIKRIVALVGTTVTVDTPADAAVSGVVVSHFAGTFVPLGVAGKVLSFTGAYDPPSLATGTSSVASISAGTVTNDTTWTCNASFDQMGANAFALSAMPSGLGTIRVVFANVSGGTVDLPAGTIRVRCSQY